MSKILDEMIAQGYAEAKAPMIEQLPHKRAWLVRGTEVSDLELMQMEQAGLITRREMLEKMP